MPLGIGIGLSPSLGKNRGGTGKTAAQLLLKNETDGMAWDWVTNSSCIRKAGVDTLGTANQFLTVVGTLTPSANGATFDASNNASVTLAALGVTAGPYQTACTLYTEMRPDTVNSIIHTAFEFSDGTINNFNRLCVQGGNNTAHIGQSANVAQWAITSGAAVASTFYKMAGGFATNDVAHSRDGAAVGTDVVAVAPVTPNKLSFGLSGAGTLPFVGNIRKVMILPRRLVNADLVTLSGTGVIPDWTPTSLGAALVAWWNADDVTTGAVTTWTDRIGGLAPTQATGSLQPVKAATSFNSAYGGVTFDGVDDYLLVASTGTLPVGTTSGEIYSSLSNTAVDNVVRLALAYGTSTIDASRGIGRPATHPKTRISDQTNNLLDDGVVNPFAGAAIVNGKWDAGTEYGFINGYPFSPTASMAAPFVTATTRTTFGAGANAPPPPNNWQGAFRHVMVINGVLSTADRQRMEGWLAWDGGMTGLLPSGHPYKTVRP